MATAADNQIVKTTGYVAKEAGLGFYNESVLIAKVDTQYSAEYGTVSGGARVGKTIRVRFPAKFTTTSSVALSAGTVQALEEDTKVLTLDERVGVHAEIDTDQATFELKTNGSEYSERVLQPMGKALVAKIETLGFVKLALESQNVTVMEDPFDDGDVLRKNFVKMRALLDKQLAPKGDRCTYLGSDAEVEVANSILPLFHSQLEITQAFKEGTMKQYGGLVWMASDLVHTRVNGGGGLATTVASYTEGSVELTLTVSTGVVVGDKISIATKLVNAESKNPYANDIQRAVLKIVGDVITIDPIWFTADNGRQNTALTPVGKAVTVLGTAGESYLCCPVFQKTAITLGSADLAMPSGVDEKFRQKVLGVSQRYIRDYQIASDALPSRFESIITWDLLRPEWAGVLELKIS